MLTDGGRSAVSIQNDWVLEALPPKPNAGSARRQRTQALIYTVPAHDTKKRPNPF